ncbi:TonB-dependent receptor [Halarcobacter bivalviorum]|uniref:TonB-dependent receptor n=1 Tax=Halarcobacter bivalviorum TaxID=663364 RepID=A0AAX2AAK7_9BACT|nr:TonB-dependent receptor [Halarcobacter bivalviorum]AXH12236.1 TonB-dependent receptor [Halarcobacter bivalviorum]RXK11342.1 TonB-dependent receptor [Halarcobacter bivalviorum]
MKIRLSLITSIILATSSFSNEVVELEKMSVTATKVQTASKDVSQSIAIVDEKEIADKNILNIQEAIDHIPGVQAESSSNSQSPRLIIRGAGLKARYGVREIMVMKDGVPMTDPDSFTRFDYIDMQDVEAIEVQKGPGSINASNTTGGVIQLITKSVFKEDKNSIKVGAGNDNQRNLNFKLRNAFDDSNFMSFSFSSRKNDNSWRENNEFDSTQGSLKYGHIFSDDSTFETELSYTESNVNLPASMTLDEFEEFKASGTQEDTSSQWQHSARDSKILSLNAKYEKEVGNITYKPRFYFNKWEHFHPVTGMINDSDDNKVYGTDLELNFKHSLFSNDAMFVAGLTAKRDKTNDSKKYTYEDYSTKTQMTWMGPVSKIEQTLSNDKGDLAGIENSDTKLYGLYVMERFKPIEDLSIDISARVDKLKFDIDGNELIKYDYSKENYATGKGEYSLQKDFTLSSAKLGLNYSLTDNTNIYTSVAKANQAPTGSELQSADDDGIDLEKTNSINYEIGLKSRTKTYAYDMALYQNNVEDEIIQVKNANGDTIYSNAGETKKIGFEVSGIYNINKYISFGANYAYSKFKFKTFEEQVRGTTESRDGNILPYIPKHQYSLFTTLNLDNGLKARLSTKTWGSYYMDNANTEKYEGYKFVTDLMLGYEKKDHSLQLNIKNLTNKYYAMEASKDVYGNETYKAAAPRSFMITYVYKF